MFRRVAVTSLSCCALALAAGGGVVAVAQAPAAASAQSATAAARLVGTVPTTKILAIGRLTGTTPPDPAAMRAIMPSEVKATVQLYLDGKLDQWYVRQDGKGVVFLLNVTSVDEAHALLEKLPLGVAGRMEFDLMPLGPLSPLRFLMGEAGGAGSK
jgi:hypothetical protein